MTCQRKISFCDEFDIFDFKHLIYNMKFFDIVIYGPVKKFCLQVKIIKVNEFNEKQVK